MQGRSQKRAKRFRSVKLAGNLPCHAKLAEGVPTCHESLLWCQLREETPMAVALPFRWHRVPCQPLYCVMPKSSLAMLCRSPH